MSNEPAPGPVPLETKAFTRRRWRLALCSLLLACGTLLLTIWVFRAPLLTGIAKAWIVDQPLQKADAIVVLGGGMETRTFAAARIYRDGFAPQILILNLKPRPSEQSGATVTEVELTKRILIKEGVPEDALQVVGKDVLSTRDEALAIRDWVSAGGRRRLIVPTDIFHTRRVNWMFHEALSGIDSEIVVTALLPREYGVSDWWRHEQGLVAFQNEVLKYTYYRVKY